MRQIESTCVFILCIHLFHICKCNSLKIFGKVHSFLYSCLHPEGIPWELTSYSGYGSRYANYKSSPLPLFLQVQSSTLIPSSVTEHLCVAGILIPKLSDPHIQWIMQTFSSIIFPPTYSFCPASSNNRHSLLLCENFFSRRKANTYVYSSQIRSLKQTKVKIPQKSNLVK